MKYIFLLICSLMLLAFFVEYNKESDNSNNENDPHSFYDSKHDVNCIDHAHEHNFVG